MVNISEPANEQAGEPIDPAIAAKSFGNAHQSTSCQELKPDMGNPDHETSSYTLEKQSTKTIIKTSNPDGNSF